MRAPVLVHRLALALAGALPDAGLAQPSPRPELVDTTPVPGLGTPRDEVPSNVQTVTDEELEHQQASTLTDHLNENVGSVTVNEAQSNAFQPDVLYRGFVASPLLGNPIGLSVYLDGVRVNEQFGDTVNWDLIPTSALSTLHVVPGSNPVFGSNTLGGALVARTRSGDTDPGLRAEAQLGSFARQRLELSQGGTLGPFDAFVAGELFSEGGCATFQSSEQLFNPVSNPADPAQPATIDVRPGDRLPGIPEHSFKLGADYRVGEDLSVGAHLLWAGSQFLRGDEDNRGPKLDDQVILDLRAEYCVSPGVSLFARLDNVFDSETETLGAWNRDAFDAEGMPLAGELGAVERFVSPGAPRTLFVGVRIELATQPPRH